MIDSRSKGLSTPCDYTLRSAIEYKRIRKQLIKAFNKFPNAAAIASNQVLFNENGEAPAVFLYRGDLYINPTYETIAGSASYMHLEGCLSLVGPTFDVERQEVVRVTYRVLKMRGLLLQISQPETHIVRGFEAAVFQHEIMHLRGVTIYSQ